MKLRTVLKSGNKRATIGSWPMIRNRELSYLFFINYNMKIYSTAWNTFLSKYEYLNEVCEKLYVVFDEMLNPFTEGYVYSILFNVVVYNLILY